MEDQSKLGYVSPSTAAMDLRVINDARPTVSISLDLGIPNFTVFSLSFEAPEGEREEIKALIAEAFHALLDDVTIFMISLGYSHEACVELNSLALVAMNEFKLSHGEDTVQEAQAKFKMPQSFVDETHAHVVTAAQKVQRLPNVRKLNLKQLPANLRPHVKDTERVIRQFRSRALRQSPRPLYIVLYDQMGRAKGTLDVNDAMMKSKLFRRTT